MQSRLWNHLVALYETRKHRPVFILWNPIDNYKVRLPTNLQLKILSSCCRGCCHHRRRATPLLLSSLSFPIVVLVAIASLLPLVVVAVALGVTVVVAVVVAIAVVAVGCCRRLLLSSPLLLPLPLRPCIFVVVLRFDAWHHTLILHVAKLLSNLCRQQTNLIWKTYIRKGQTVSTHSPSIEMLLRGP